MKRFVLGKLFIISAALIVLSFISCNQNLKEENGMGKVVISLGNTARNVNTEGLPILDEHNTTITINVAGESEQHHHIQDEHRASKISVEFPIGTEITVTADVKTAAGIYWWGKKTLTVAAGVNNVSLELSKTPVNVPGVGFSLSKEENTFSIEIGSNEIKHKLAVSKDFTPKIKRDGIGRVYVLYKDKDDKKHLTRYTVEGKSDKTFNEAISTLTSNFINKIENIAVDTKTGNIFLIDGTASAGGIEIYCITKEGEDFYSGSLSGGVAVNSAAAYNGTLFVAGIKDNDTKLLAYTTELRTENNELELTSACEATIGNISPEGQSGKTDCNDIYADDTGVYVLLSSTSLKGNIYSVGQINSYEYDYNNGSFGTNVKTAGRTTAQLENGGIAFVDKDYYSKFSKPVAFTGWYKDRLYIADDGINIEYKKASENCRVDGNKNRIATFFKGDNKLDFHLYANISPDTTWYEEYPKYTQPNTPVLSWEKGTHGMKYWTSADGIEDFSNKNKLWASTDSSSIKPTDIFCYDQDGNLYIVYIKDNDKMVRRFELKYDGSYDTANTQSITLDNEPTAIAVDISNGKNCLYYAYEEDSHNKSTIKKYNWSNDFTIGEILNVITETTTGYWIDITALAANQYGLFAAIKNVDITNKYTLSVKKYKKDGSEIDNISEVFKHETADSHGTTSPYNSYTGAINALQIRNNILYGIMSEVTQHNTYGGTQYSVDGFKNGSRLYGFGKTDESLFKSELINKTNNDDTVGYGFYRFIAVQENNLVIASDGAWEGKVNGTMKAFNNNKVFTCNFNSEGSISSISQTDDLTTVKYTIQK